MIYVRVSGIFEGEPYRYQVCRWCDWARQGLLQWMIDHPSPFLDAYDDAPVLGELFSFLREEWPELFADKESP